MTNQTKHASGKGPSLRQDLDRLLKGSLADKRLSKSERRQLEALITGAESPQAELAQLRHRAVQIAKSAVDDGGGRVVAWLGEVFKALSDDSMTSGAMPKSEAHFSPGDSCVQRITALLQGATKQVDICVFTITDNRVADQILAAHRRGVALRVITDDEKSCDAGSDIDRLQKAGVPVRFDNSVHHMHHKFALFDRHRLLTGSYNWTRAAARDNQENIIITGDPLLVEAFANTFEELWRRFKEATQ